jgi:hypothetical protein
MAKLIQTLKDSRHSIIGFIEQESNGNLILKDARHSIKGFYDVKNNVTKDARHAIVGYGNILGTLL